MDYFFAGYDPGLTTAVALVSLDGNLVAVKSGRELKESEIIGFVGAFGKPIFICADKTPAPAAVEKLAAIFEAPVFEPRTPLSVEAKKELCADLSLENAHERDAAAAALNAYNHHLNKIRNLKKKLPDEEIAKILQGRPQETPKEEEKAEKQARRTDVPALLRQLKIIEEDRARLRASVGVLEGKIARLESSPPQPARTDEKNTDKRIEEKNSRIAELKRTIGRTEAVLAEERKNRKAALKYYGLALEHKQPVKTLDELSEAAILGLERTIGIAKGDVILCKKPGGKGPAEMLASRGIAAVIVKGLPEEVESLLEEKKVKIYHPEHVKLSMVDGILVLEKHEKKEEIELEGIIKSYRESRSGAQAP